MLKAELKREGVTYARFAEKLAKIDAHENKKNSRQLYSHILVAMP